MKIRSTSPVLLATALLVVVPSRLRAATAATISGSILDSTGRGLPGVGVSLALGGGATTTDLSGNWSISVAADGLAPHIPAKSAPESHPVFDGHRIRVRYRGMDAAGRASFPVAVTQNLASVEPAGNRNAAREATASIDTIRVTWNGRHLVRLPIAITADSSGISFRIDTAWSDDFGSPWNPRIAYGSLLDRRDGQVYRTVDIGGKRWMAENLALKVDRSWCYGDSASCGPYGRLYGFAAAMDADPSADTTLLGAVLPRRGICPVGWHVPSDTEWKAMALSVDSFDFGTMLKAKSRLWTRNTGTDDVGFRVLPAGYRVGDGSYKDRANIGAFFTSVETDATSSVYEGFNGAEGSIWVDSGLKTGALSLRCIAD